jgi:murein DD-endopeptidase MepM/ murein hydrolase activator NlpD
LRSVKLVTTKKQSVFMRNPSVKPIIISPVPATALPPAPRPMSVKRLSRVRANWFAVGSVFGLSLSFFVNYIHGAALVPAYDAVLAQFESSSSVTPTKTAVAEAKSKTVFEVAATKAPETPAPAEEAKAETPPPTYPIKLALQVGKGDTLLDMLIANRVQSTEAHEVINALKAKFNPGKLRVGQKISVTLDRHEKLGDMAAVKELAIKLPNLSTIELQRLQNGGFNVASTEETSTQKTYRGFGKVRSSLLQAGADGGIPASAMQEVLKAFSYDVDFQREIHPGDTIEVLVDRKANKSGGFTNAGGKLRYASLTLQGKKHEIFRFKDSWYDGKGNSIKKSLLRTPLDAARITSGFGLRTHPIMGYTKMHRGVDFGAPSGTPIMAAGDGVVSFKGWKSGYGNFVTIKHNAKYESAYGHISRFGNIKVGGKVRQGQVIAYVGMTGMATGPHLHYEVRENDTQVNPVAKQFNMANNLSGKTLAAFKTAKQSALNELASLAKGPAKVASTQ